MDLLLIIPSIFVFFSTKFSYSLQQKLMKKKCNYVSAAEVSRFILGAISGEKPNIHPLQCDFFLNKYRARISNCPHLHFLYNEGIYLCSFKLYIFTYKIYGNIQCCKSCIWLIPDFLLAVFLNGDFIY